MFKFLKVVAILNLLGLGVDLILVYIASRSIKTLYEQIGLQAIYNIGVFNVKVRSAIVILASFTAFFKLWAIKGKRNLGAFDRITFYIIFIFLAYRSWIVLRMFFETAGRI